MDRKISKLEAMEDLNDDAKILVTKKDIPIIVEAFLTGIRPSSVLEDKYKSKLDSSRGEDSDSNSEESSDEDEKGGSSDEEFEEESSDDDKKESSDEADKEEFSDEDNEDSEERGFKTDDKYKDEPRQNEVKSEWPFFFVVAIDLGMEADGIKRMKSGLLSGTLNDAAGLSEILLCWIAKGGEEGNKEATWDNLISVLSSNITLFPGNAKKDYVGILKQLHPGMTENNETQSVMAVFNNDLIRDEILKYLPFEEKQDLRRLSRSFNELMLPDWRKKLSAFCIGALDNGNDNNNAYTFQDFYEFYEGNEALKLEEYPHRAVMIINEDIVLYGSRFLKMQKFWEHFAENLTALEFKSCHFERDFLDTFRWILLKACPNLESLKLTGTGNAILEVDDVEDLEKEKRTEEVVFAGEIATNLKYLEVDMDVIPLSTANLQHLLEYTPCVEALSLCHVGLLEGLLKPRSSDEPFKLHTLTMYYNQESFLPLQRLTAQYPNSIKHLSILDLDFSIVRSQNIGPAFYLGIGQCQALCSLRLAFIQADTLRVPWLIELSTMEFPQLKTLHICFDNENKVQRFDFAALKGMPQLKRLSIVYQNPVNVSLRIQEEGGIEDWVYDGALEPSYLNKSYIFKNHSEDSLIKLESLEEFEFFGWDITEQDVSLFSEWFPGLRILKTGIRSSSLWPCKLTSFFPRLEMLVLRNDNDLKGLMNLRRIIKNVRFLVQSNGDSESRVELKTGDDYKVCLLPY